MAKSFFIRSKKSKGIAPLYVEIRKRTPNVRFTTCTEIDVDIETWNMANRNERSWRNFIMTDYGKCINEKLELIEKAVNSLFVDGVIQSIDDRKAVEDAVRAVSYRVLQEHKDALAEKRKQEEERKKRSILGFYAYFMEGIRDGSIRYGKDRRYSSSSCLIWQNFGVYLRGYCRKDTITFDDVTKQFADKFSVYLEKLGMMPTTIKKNVGCFRKLCNLAAEMGINSNAVSLRVWKERNICDYEKKAEVYLTDEELDALYRMRLSGEREVVRDLFLLGCLSCQRFSDFSRFTKDDLVTLDDGTLAVSIVQKKTGSEVLVPIVDDRFTEIAEKYKYKIPSVPIVIFNRVIKEVARDLSKSVRSLTEKYVTRVSSAEIRSELLYQRLCEKVEAAKGGLKVLTADEKNEYFKLKRYAKEHNGSPLWERNATGEVIRPKHELITSHTARRSGITNLYKTGLLDNREMMSISGHKTERVFEEYIRMGNTEKALRVASKLKSSNGKERRAE